MGNRKKVRKTVQHEKTFDGGGATVKTIRSHKDVDSEDDFEATQDKILLEGQARDTRATAGDLEASDEEVLALPTEDSDEDEEDYDSGSEEDDEDVEEPEEGWGDSKKEYYNNDEVSDEEDQKAEEEEALRIQRKNLAKLDASAYVDEFQDWKNDEAEENTAVTEVLPTTISKDLPKSELLKILHTRNPEFSPFAIEFTTLISQLEHLDTLASRKHHPQHDLIQAKMKALRSYLAVLAFYFALISSEQATTINIKEHEIMISLVRCRQAWQMVEPIDIDENLFEPTPVLQAPIETEQTATSKPRKRKRSNKTTAPVVQTPIVESYAPDQDEELEETFRALKSLPKKRKVAALPDLADNVADSIDAEDAAARRKTLQFYASQINSKSNRRSAAQQSGDQDIPYRERRKERELRLQAEAERRKGGTAGADLDDEETGPRESKDVASDDEYYQLVASAQKSEKAARKQDHDEAVAAVRAERAGYALPEQVDGKRKIGRDIAANKGLTVNRPKENRNARVKKRNKYEAAKKKLGSQKAIFKQPTGSYGGETSGINARVIKSTKMDQGNSKRR